MGSSVISGSSVGSTVGSGVDGLHAANIIDVAISKDIKIRNVLLSFIGSSLLYISFYLCLIK
jgi:hypothetical protein